MTGDVEDVINTADDPDIAIFVAARTVTGSCTIRFSSCRLIGILLWWRWLGRLGRPEEIARAAVFLASEASSFVNGHILYVDGGITASL